MAIVNLKYIQGILEAQKKQSQITDSTLWKSSLQKPKIASNVEFNYAYYTGSLEK